MVHYVKCLINTQFEDGEPISLPPERGENDNYFSNPDDRIIVCQLARKTEFEQLMAEFEQITTSSLRCNTSMQILVSIQQAKTAMHYISNYMSKHPNQLKSCLALLKQATDLFKEYGSKATDVGHVDRMSKNILQKVLNMTGNIEVSSMQAVALLLDKDSFISSHHFRFVYIWQAVAAFHESENDFYTNIEVEEADEIEQKDHALYTKFDIDEKEKKAVQLSGFHCYKNRGSKLRHLSLFSWVNHINPAVSLERNEIQKKRGRKKSKLYKYVKGSDAAKCKQQCIRANPIIPRIGGKDPPSYPGDPPDIKNPQRKYWNKKARIFVEFYSLLFFPLDINGYPIEPFHQILPWNNKTSWDNFWLIMDEFESSNVLYYV